MSPRRVVPMAAASKAIRTNPSRRDSTVPAAITAAERRVRSAILRPDSFFQALLGMAVGFRGDRELRLQLVGLRLDRVGNRFVQFLLVEWRRVQRVRSGFR